MLLDFEAGRDDPELFCDILTDLHQRVAALTAAAIIELMADDDPWEVIRNRLAARLDPLSSWLAGSLRRGRLSLMEGGCQFADLLIEFFGKEVELGSLQGLAGSGKADSVEPGQFKRQPLNGELITLGGDFEMLDLLMG